MIEHIPFNIIATTSHAQIIILNFLKIEISVYVKQL